MHCFLTTLFSWLRVHKLGVRWIKLLSYLLRDLLMPLMLTHQKCLLIRQELATRARLITLLPIDLWLEAQVFIHYRSFLDLTLRLEFPNTISFPCI